jgi:CBS domain-containing protein
MRVLQQNVSVESVVQKLLRFVVAASARRLLRVGRWNMAIAVREIMNHEVIRLRPDDRVGDAIRSLVDAELSAGPVVDRSGAVIGMISLRDLVAANADETVVLRMSPEIGQLGGADTVEEAARLIGQTGLHHVPVVDDHGQLIGVLASTDVVRELAGLPARHPTRFSDRDRISGVCWTDDRPLELDRVEAAPESAGVLALVRGGQGCADRVVWTEACDNLRQRLIEMLSEPETKLPVKKQWLREHELRFRVAPLDDGLERQRVAESLLRSNRDSGRPSDYGIEQMFAEHKRLALLIDRMRLIAQAPDDAASADRWRAVLARDLDKLSSMLAAHFQAEERNGYMSGVLERAPALAHQVEVLLRQHKEMREQFVQLNRAVQGGQGLEAVRDGLRRALAMLVHHEQQENELVQEAYQRDVGAGD